MIATLKKAFFKHAYLFIAAAWLYTFSFIFENYIAFTSAPTRVTRAIERDLRNNQRDFERLVHDGKTLPLLVSPRNYVVKEKLCSKPYGIFVYQLNDRNKPFLIYWNTQVSVPEEYDISNTDSSIVVRARNGYYQAIKHTVVSTTKKYVVVAMIPIKWDFERRTRYLQDEFVVNNDIHQHYNLSFNATQYPIKDGDGNVLFFLEKKPDEVKDKPDIITVVFRFLAVICLLLFIHSLSLEVLYKHGFRKSFAFLLVNIVVLRLLSYWLSFLFDFEGYALFDSDIYSSSFLHRSLGDLVVNALLAFWLVIFLKFKIESLKPTLNKYSARTRQVIAVACTVLLIWYAFEAADIIRTLIVDSKISFDVTNFFSLNIYTLISFITLGVLLITFYHLSHVLLIPVKHVYPSLMAKLLLLSVAGLVILTITINSNLTPFRMSVLIWITLYLVASEMERGRPYETMLKSPMFLFWVIFFSASVTTLLITENRTKERKQREQFAQRIATQTDVSGQFMISLAVEGLNRTFFDDNVQRWVDARHNSILKDSIIHESFSGYLTKYDTEVFTFDKYLRPLHNENPVSHKTLETAIKVHEEQTLTPDLKRFEVMEDRWGFAYKKEMVHNDSLFGYFYIVAKPRLFKTEGLYPELFKEESPLAQLDDESDYSYAVYNRQQLVKNTGTYNFPNYIQSAEIPRFQEAEWKNSEGFEQLWYKAKNNKVVVVVKNHSLFIETLTLFAYFFCAFLLITTLLHMGSVLLRARFRYTTVRDLIRINISTQIQATIVFVTVFSFIVIGIATISFFIERFENDNQERLGRTVEVLRAEIEASTKGALAFDSSEVALLGASGVLEKQLLEISELHNADVNLYDLSGVLRASTQPYIYNKHILSNRMNPVAYFQLHSNRRVKWVQEEWFKEFRYLSMYIPIRDGQGNAQAYLNVPFLNSQSELKQEISNFLITLINLNAFIFLMSAAIAVLVTNRIIKSLTLIGRKMREVSLGRKNEEIRWYHNDEIGALVKEYNKMVRELEESARQLARTEREGAWREMAKQVAHEIKNPLTPMKLSIQYLQRAIDTNADNVKELSQKVAGTLVQQIDQLARIASDFSQFANINTTNRERFNLTEVIQLVVNLHNADSNVRIEHELGPGNYEVAADKNQVNRLFTNLIKNAIEAAGKNELALIDVKQYNVENTILISVKDNGAGIPVDMWNKIFTPNFTTKSSGTGLGLAICKGIVENAGGSIWFETEEGKGTTFFVSLPHAL